MDAPFRTLVVAQDPALRAELEAALAEFAGEDADAPCVLLVVDDPGADPAHVLFDARKQAVGPVAGLVLLLGEPAGARVADALRAGAGDAVAWPAAPEELCARLERVYAVEQAFTALRDQRVQDLVALLEMASPGARERARRVVHLAGRLAQDCEVPAAMHVELAAAGWLWEVGRLVRPDRAAATEDVILASGAIVRATKGLEAAAELVSSIAENWDGTGRPGRRRLGQIPFRSRLLRVAIDYLAATDAGCDPRAALQQLAVHAGTRYDPQVLGHLAHVFEATRQGGFTPTRRVVPVQDLVEGMVLAEDLYAESGVKLLAEGTPLSRTALEAIKERHLVDPILHGAVVRRKLRA